MSLGGIHGQVDHARGCDRLIDGHRCDVWPVLRRALPDGSRRDLCAAHQAELDHLIAGQTPPARETTVPSIIGPKVLADVVRVVRQEPASTAAMVGKALNIGPTYAANALAEAERLGFVRRVKVSAAAARWYAITQETPCTTPESPATPTTTATPATTAGTTTTSTTASTTTTGASATDQGPATPATDTPSSTPPPAPTTPPSPSGTSAAPCVADVAVGPAPEVPPPSDAPPFGPASSSGVATSDVAALSTTPSTTSPGRVPACLFRWGSCEAHGHAHECGSPRGHFGPPPYGPEPTAATAPCEHFGCGDDVCLVTEPAPAAEAPTAPPVPDEGAASPAGPGEAVRSRVGAWAGENPHLREHGARDSAAEVYGPPMHRRWVWSAYRPGSVIDLIDDGEAPTLDAAKAAADAALEAAGYELEGGAHVDPGVDTLAEVAHAAAAKAEEADRLRDEVVRAARGFRLIAEAAGAPEIAAAASDSGGWTADHIATLRARVERLQDLADSRKHTISDLDMVITTIRFALGDSPTGWEPPAGVDPVVDLALAVRQDRDNARKDEASAAETIARLTAELAEAKAAKAEQAIRDVEVVLGVPTDQVLPRLRELVRAEAKCETNQALVNLFVQGRRA